MLYGCMCEGKGMHLMHSNSLKGHGQYEVRDVCFLMHRRSGSTGPEYI